MNKYEPIKAGDVLFKHFEEGPTENVWFLVTKRTPKTVAVTKIKGDVHLSGEQPLKDKRGKYVKHESGETHLRLYVNDLPNGKEDVKCGFVYLNKYEGGLYPTYKQVGGPDEC